MWNTFAFAYAIGYHFIASDAGVCNGNFLGIGADMVANASVQVEAADPSGILCEHALARSLRPLTPAALQHHQRGVHLVRQPPIWAYGRRLHPGRGQRVQQRRSTIF